MRLRAGYVHIGVDVRSKQAAIVQPWNGGLAWRVRVTPPTWDSPTPMDEPEVYVLLRQRGFRCES